MFIIYLFFTMGGLTLMKLGGGQLNLGVKNGFFSLSIGIKLLIAFIMYGVSFLIWSNIVAKNDLTYIMPLSTAITNVLTIVIGVLVFKETMTSIQVLGVIVAVIGVIMMNIR